jgi:hypothetical protein
MVTVAGVSLLLARGSIAWATVSVMRSPMTTTRVTADHHLDHRADRADIGVIRRGTLGLRT